MGNQVTHGDITIAQGIDAIDPTSYAEVFSTPGHLIEGDFLQPGDTEGIVLGVGAAGADRTDLRTYGGSLKTVHAGDEVEVGLVGGETHTFVVRGIYQNDFPLSDLGALVTTRGGRPPRHGRRPVRAGARHVRRHRRAERSTGQGR